MPELEHSNEPPQNTLPVGKEGDQMILGGGNTGIGGIPIDDDDDEDAPMYKLPEKSSNDENEEYTEDDDNAVKEAPPKPPQHDPYKDVTLNAFESALSKEKEERKLANVQKTKEEPAKQSTPNSAPTSKDVTPAVKASKDFSGFDEKEIEMLKRMSGRTFDWLRPQLVEYRELKSTEIPKLQQQIKDLQSGKTALPESYYEHPEAYTLYPDYKEASRKADTLSFIANHFQDQLAKVEAGEQWIDLIEQKDGQLSYSQPQDASPVIKAKMLRYIMSTEQELTSTNAHLKQIRDGFKQRYQQDVDEIGELKKKYFNGYDDPKHPTKPIQEKISSLLPQSFRNSPVGELLIYTGAANAVLKQQLEAANEKIKALEGIKQDSKAAGPKAGEMRRGPVNNGSKISMAKFREVING